MKKYILDLTVTDNKRLSGNYVLLKLTHRDPLPDMLPGQFAELRVDSSPGTFLRRPISINYVDREKNEIWFLIQVVGAGTRALASLQPGDVLNTILPLGNSFTFPERPLKRLLLVGGGVGIAPLFYLGKELVKQGFDPTFILGARSGSDLLQREKFEKLGKVCFTTEDGSCGEKGFVTHHSILTTPDFDFVYTCGPKPMMMAVAAYAKKYNIECEASLENKIACGIGACLCCVENTTKGHICVCSEGPVFNTKQLLWQI